MLKAEALSDPRYDCFGPDMNHWMDDCTQRIGGKIDADGGAGN
jgi:hypothetical protein